MTMVEENAENRPRPMLRLVTGGKGPPEGPKTENWLNDLKKGCVFSCQRKGEVVSLKIYNLVFRHTKTFILSNALNPEPFEAVKAEGFSQIYSLVEILEEGGERPEVIIHDQRTVRPSGVANNADAPGGQQTDG